MVRNRQLEQAVLQSGKAREEQLQPNPEPQGCGIFKGNLSWVTGMNRSEILQFI